MESQRKDLLSALQLLVFNKGSCFHRHLEEHTSSPMESSLVESDNNLCHNACPIYSGLICDSILPAKKKEMQSFLVDAFINSNIESIGGEKIIVKLQKFPNVGIEICGRPKSPKPPEKKYLHSTILQLIASELITLNASSDHKSTTFALGITDAIPSHLIDSKWTNIKLID